MHRDLKKNFLIKLVIFDLDGTIVDAYRAIKNSINFTLKTLGHPQVSSYAVRRAVGWGDENFIKSFIKEDQEAQRALVIYRKHHKTSLLKFSRVIPGVRKVLSFLRNRDIELAIASNRPPRFTDILLKHLDLKKYFDLIVCAKNKEEIKPKPDLLLRIIKRLKVAPRQALYVGDMVIDVYAGKNAKIRTISVLGGSSTKEELRKARPFKIIQSLEGFKKFFS